MNGYICFWNQNREEVHAASSYEAQEKARARFQKSTRKKVKGYDICTVIAEVDGFPVVHSNASL